MRLLDRYLAKTFGKAFFWMLLISSVSAVVLDYMSRIGYFQNPRMVKGTFAEQYSEAKMVLLFYVAYLPFLLKQVLPFVSLGAGLLTLSAMIRHNEIMPIVAAGVPVRRLVAPLLVCGALVSVGHFALDEFVLPALGRKQIALTRFFAGDRRRELRRLPHFRDGKGTVTRAAAYSYDDQSLTDVVIHRPWSRAGFERWSVPRLVRRGDRWIAPLGGLIMPAGIRVAPRTLPPGSSVDFGLTASEVEALTSRQATMQIPYSQLKKLVRKFPGRRNLTVAMHKQISRPFTSFVLLLLGIPVLLGADRRKRFQGAAIAFGLCASFYFLDIFFASLGDRGDLSPLMAAYFPLALVFSVGLARLLTVRT